MHISLIPQPEKIQFQGGSFSQNIRIAADNPYLELCLPFTELCQSKLKIPVQITSAQANVEFVFQEHVQEEAYQLDILQTKIKLAASSKSGFINGLHSLFQLLCFSNNATIPCLSIMDKPFFSWRGIHLDESRHFFGKDFVKKLLDFAGLYKINKFHWHLTDDNGWRIEIKKYPKLHEIASQRINREHLPWKERDFPKQESESTFYGGYYTQTEMKEIVRYAAERNITIVPEIEMPGHCRAVFAAYPEFSCSGEKRSVAAGINTQYRDVFCAGNEKTYLFLTNILQEICSLFPGEYIHLGGDEVNPYNWLHCSQCQTVMQTNNWKDWHQLQHSFMQRMTQKAKDFGKIPIVWDELLDSGKLEDTLIMIWRRNGEKSVGKAEKNHNQVILCPSDTFYFDWKQESSPRAKGAFGVTPLEKVYHFSKYKSPNVLGLQGNIWTEFMPDSRRVEYMSVPRICALAENCWSNPKRKNWKQFQSKLISHEKVFNFFSMNYFRDPSIWNNQSNV